jgi:hypothetical protein
MKKKVKLLLYKHHGDNETSTYSTLGSALAL